MGISANQMLVLRTVAGQLKVPPAWLEGIINFETAGTWNPLIKNPLSSGRGLIQFMDATAKGLGYKDSLDLVTKHPTVESQLQGPVLKYFRQFAPFTTQQDFEYSVFLPKYRKASPDTLIYHDDDAKRNKFQAANPGIKTVGDYSNKLRRAFARIKGVKPATGLGAAVVLVSLGTFIFFLTRRRPRNVKKTTQ